MRSFNCLIFILLYSINIHAQTIIKQFSSDSVTNYLKNAAEVTNKLMPTEYASVIKLALMYYPELAHTHIKIRVKKQPSPLTARPSVWAMFQQPAKRKYLITISNKVAPQFSAILLSNLSFIAQVGVIGHELSHVVDYNNQKGRYFIKLLAMQLNSKAINKFEYATDMRCIAHGLGYQLLAWSTEVRLKLNLVQWKGIKELNKPGNERYMNPESIKRAMVESKMHN